MVRIIIYVTLIIEDIFRSLSNAKLKGRAHVLLGEGKFGHFLAEKKVTLQWLMNSNMVKPEKFGHLHLVYHFTVPLKVMSNFFIFHKKEVCKKIENAVLFHLKTYFDLEIFKFLQFFSIFSFHCGSWIMK